MSGKRPRSEDSEPEECSKRLCLDPEQAHDRPELPSDTTLADTQGTEPLTTANLRRLQRQINPAMVNVQASSGRISRLTSPSRSNLSNTVAATSNVPENLGSFDIYIDQREPMPTDLKKLLDMMTMPHPGPTSPNTVIVVRRQRVARMRPEADGIDMLRRPLLGETSLEASDDEARAEGIDHSRNANLCKTFLPPLRHNPSGSTLKVPQPDSMFGYLLAEYASQGGLEGVFSRADERILRHAQVCSDLHFPFLTCQWKSTSKQGTHTEAQQQGARDGATIVNSTYCYLKNASPGLEPSAAKTCHFSATCDMLSMNLYIHWRRVKSDEMAYEMDLIGQWFLSDETHLRKARDTIKNITHWVKTERLEMLKTAIPGYTNAIARQPTNSQLLTPSMESSTCDSVEPDPKKRKISTMISDAIVEGSITSLFPAD